jgi:hypothetical protein
MGKEFQKGKSFTGHFPLRWPAAAHYLMRASVVGSRDPPVGPSSRHDPCTVRMPACAPATLSHCVGCGALWRHIAAVRSRYASRVLAPTA